jgi:hypothetical protein
VSRELTAEEIREVITTVGYKFIGLPFNEEVGQELQKAIIEAIEEKEAE